MVLGNEELLRLFNLMILELGFELVTREFELVTRGFELAFLNFSSCFYALTLTRVLPYHVFK